VRRHPCAYLPAKLFRKGAQRGILASNSGHHMAAFIMRESRFGFQYSWADLQPVRALAVTVVAAQFAGAVAGFLFPRFAHWFESLWFGGALATFPAFLLGLVVQATVKPGSLSANVVMVRRLGLVAALLSGFAVAMPIFGFGSGS
jgi:hypothetical protein